MLVVPVAFIIESLNNVSDIDSSIFIEHVFSNSSDSEFNVMIYGLYSFVVGDIDSTKIKKIIKNCLLLKKMKMYKEITF